MSEQELVEVATDILKQVNIILSDNLLFVGTVKTLLSSHLY